MPTSTRPDQKGEDAMPAASPAAPATPSTTYGQRLGRVAVLIIDDEPGMRNFMARILGPLCRRIELAGSLAEADEWLLIEHFDVVVLDNMLGNERGLEWLATQRLQRPMPPVVLISAFADLEVAIQAMQAGATDMLLKPFRSNQLLTAVARSAEQARLQNENQILRHELRRRPEGSPEEPQLTGSSAAITEMRNTIARVAPLPSSVLLTGPSGSGKEVAARMIHALSDRASSPFVAINSATMSEDMVEADLFGEVGNPRRGLFLQAQGGTLLFDEIAELPLTIQARLLRVLEDRRIRPVGAERDLPIDVRLIFATNTDLPALIAEGRFRADLYYRINIVHLAMPALKDRGSDVVDLARVFMKTLSARLGMRAVPLTPEVEAGLQAQDWPGNIRELRNMIERVLILGQFPPELTAHG